MTFKYLKNERYFVVNGSIKKTKRDFTYSTEDEDEVKELQSNKDFREVKDESVKK